MDLEESGSKRRVLVSELRPGMYVVRLGQSSFQTPLAFHRRIIQDAEEIELLKSHGIQDVVIDTARGSNVESSDSQIQVASNPRPPRAAETIYQPLVKELAVARTIHAEALAAAKNIFEGVATGAPINNPAAKKVVTDLLDSITRSPEANLLLAQMRRFQNDLFTHAVNVCVLCLVVGTVEELEGEISTLGLGALLHDIGKTRIPRNVIRKKFGHTESERKLLEQHPRLGALLVAEAEISSELVKRIVAEHHERIDGSGYPSGICDGEISLFSQLVAVTDAYDSMLTGRGQAPTPATEVLRQLYLQANCGAYDCNLIERVIRCLGVYPIGSLVELNTGERGIVIAVNRNDTLKPTLRLISARNGLELSNGPIVNLADSEPGRAERRIVRALDPAKERVNVMSYLKLQPSVAR